MPTFRTPPARNLKEDVISGEGCFTGQGSRFLGLYEDPSSLPRPKNAGESTGLAISELSKSAL